MSPALFPQIGQDWPRYPRSERYNSLVLNVEEFVKTCSVFVDAGRIRKMVRLDKHFFGQTQVFFYGSR